MLGDRGLVGDRDRLLILSKEELWVMLWVYFENMGVLVVMGRVCGFLVVGGYVYERGWWWLGCE